MRRFVAQERRAEGLGHGLRQRGGIGDGAQAYKGGAVGKCTLESARRLDGQPRLADATGADERKQPAVVISQQAGDCGQLGGTADKGRGRIGQRAFAGRLTSSAAPAAMRVRPTGSVSTGRSPRAQARKMGRYAGGTCSACASSSASSGDGWRSSASIFLIMAVEQKTCSAIARWVKRSCVRRCLIHSPKE